MRQTDGLKIREFLSCLPSKVPDVIPFQMRIDSNDKIRKFLEKRGTYHFSSVGSKIKQFFKLCLQDYGRDQVREGAAALGVFWGCVLRPHL